MVTEGKKLLVEGYNNFYCQLFLSQLDVEVKKLKLNEEEVQELKWFSRTEIEDKLPKPISFRASV